MTTTRKSPHMLNVMLTTAEHEAIHAMAKERGLTLRALVISSVLGSEPTDVQSAIADLRCRVAKLEGRK